MIIGWVITPGLLGTLQLKTNTWGGSIHSVHTWVTSTTFILMLVVEIYRLATNFKSLGSLHMMCQQMTHEACKLPCQLLQSNYLLAHSNIGLYDAVCNT